ncbi:VPS10 domain-containing receptor SorCS3 [Liparis tanakae]|uniref:VPS10 domain-containing receptor SorCS3 n=1 Tax=Liparis tanakae TaxID=230148 RepID=A0A4Z2IJ17_9TELE|nr:VPS10 domain-containing receptor SorCS3 [Liparis tanakae]
MLRYKVALQRCPPLVFRASLQDAGSGSAECAPENRAEHPQPRLQRSTDSRPGEGDTGESELANMKVSNVKTSGEQKTRAGATRHKTRAKRTSGNTDDDDKRSRPAGSAQSQDPGEDTSSAAGRRVTRSELRWSGAEHRGTGPKQEELKLNSSTFALTGDSSHNQAMVHWSGQNSSVKSCDRRDDNFVVASGVNVPLVTLEVGPKGGHMDLRAPAELPFEFPLLHLVTFQPEDHHAEWARPNTTADLREYRDAEILSPARLPVMPAHGAALLCGCCLQGSQVSRIVTLNAALSQGLLPVCCAQSWLWFSRASLPRPWQRGVGSQRGETWTSRQAGRSLSVVFCSLLESELVILMLTKLFDFNLNSVTESSLWRSTDYGATYQKLNDKVMEPVKHWRI